MAFVGLKNVQLQLLSYLAPPIAGTMATRLFSESRNEANQYKPALTPMGARSLTINSSEHRVDKLYIWGEIGDIVLLTHGWGSNCSSMFGFVEPLLSKGFRVATFDGPAHGSSTGKYTTMSEYVAAVRHVIRQLRDVKAIVSHSLGGIVALASSSQSEGIERLVLISSPQSLMDVLDIWSSKFKRLPLFIHTRILDKLHQDNGVPVSHWDVSLHGIDRHSPVLIVHDGDDDVVSVTHAEKIHRMLPNSELIKTNGLGHIRILMNQYVHDAIAQFVAS